MTNIKYIPTNQKMILAYLNKWYSKYQKIFGKITGDEVERNKFFEFVDKTLQKEFDILSQKDRWE